MHRPLAVQCSDQILEPQVEDYVNDKLNFVGPVRARTGNEILKGFRALEPRYSQLTLPILAVHGTSDRCTSLPVPTCLSPACVSVVDA